MKYIERTTKINNDKYTEYVFEAFDIQDKESTSVKIPINFKECKTFEWNIGVIYGGSGTGKTTLLKTYITTRIFSKMFKKLKEVEILQKANIKNQKVVE